MNCLTARRKLAFATWGSPRESNVYGKVTVDLTKALEYIEQLWLTTGRRISITHLVAKAAANAMLEVPGLNGRMAFGRFAPHRGVDIAFLIALDNGREVGCAKVEDVERKPVLEIAAELQKAVAKLRAKEDKDFEKSKKFLRLLPIFIIRPMLWATGVLTAKYGVRLKIFGLEPFPFGSCIISNIGLFGIDEAYAPPLPFARVPLCIVIGMVREQPQVVDGCVVPRPQVTLCATIDHRYIDGAYAGLFGKLVRKALEDPLRLELGNPSLLARPPQPQSAHPASPDTTEGTERVLHER